MTKGVARWRSPNDRRAAVFFVVCLAAGVLVRLLLLPAPGLRGDLDQFVLWVHGIAVGGLPNAYDQNLSFPPVMAYIWGLLATVDPAFRSVTDSSDPAIRAIMKLPATLADFGLAALVAYALRDRRPWAAIAAAAFLLHPAVIDLSAWWGQYESIYMLSALAATILAINGRAGWAAAALAVSLMTKPQVLPMLVPFAAWFWATGGLRGLARAAAIGIAVIVVLWLPFVPAGGPANYLRNVAEYQGDVFAILSLRAWNLWWLLQVAIGGANFVLDSNPIIGPVTLRHVGLAATAILEAFVAIAVVKDPRPRTLIRALAASVLIAFCFLTTMHERYSYGALVFLLLLIPDVRLRWLNLAFGTVFTLNLLWVAPPTPDIAVLIGTWIPLTVLGSVAMLAITAPIILMLTRRPASPATRGPVHPRRLAVHPP